MQCKICGKESMFKYCQDCQEDNKTLLTVIESLQDKLSRRNMQIKALKKTISELNEGLGKLKKDFEDFTTERSVTFQEEVKLNR